MDPQIKGRTIGAVAREIAETVCTEDDRLQEMLYESIGRLVEEQGGRQEANYQGLLKACRAMKRGYIAKGHSDVWNDKIRQLAAEHGEDNERAVEWIEERLQEYVQELGLDEMGWQEGAMRLEDKAYRLGLDFFDRF